MDEEYVPKMKAPNEFLGYYITLMRYRVDNELHSLLFKCIRTSNKYGNYNRHFYYAVPVAFKNYLANYPLPKKRKYNLTGAKPPEYGEFRLVEDVEGYTNASHSKILEKIGRSGRVGIFGSFQPTTGYELDFQESTLQNFKNEIAKDQENMEL
jgi:hypothetical protein